MDKETLEKVNQILGFIEKDRMVPEDPFFSTRLLAKTGEYFSMQEKKSDHSLLWGRLRPALAAAAIVTGIFAGIFSGSRLMSVNSPRTDLDRSVRLEQYAKESFLSEINSPVEEQVLLK